MIRTAAPRLAMPPLPIDGVMPQLLAALRDASAVVLVAEPGAGKTTRVPLALLGEAWTKGGKILVLEPRRIAARAAAGQMARLLGEAVGDTVGYRVRLESKVSGRTRIEVVTEGIFSRMVIDDPSLEGVAAVLFDEFHERSLDADLGLALALDAQAGLRDDLRLLVMSATLDAARVASLMGNAPLIASEGRSFPVETRYLGRDVRARLEDEAGQAVLKALREQDGSVLVFLPGTGEINRTQRWLEERVSDPAVMIVPLHGTQEADVQDAAIRPPPTGQRKVVLATSIAETSLTIEGVRIVIDSGLARVPRYDPASGLTSLETVRVSLAAADQRRGRAGRLSAGVCYRLWDEGQTRALEPFRRPQIMDADLAPLMLDCAAFGVVDPASLRFMDAPPVPALTEARTLLRELEAIDEAGRLTAFGRALGRMPLPPRLGAMLLQAARRGAARLAGDVAVLLTERGLGGNDVDLTHRLSQFRVDRSPRAQSARRMAQGWVRGLDTGGEDEGLGVGALLALAYPDRIAKARGGGTGDFLLANGRGAFIEPGNSLAREPYLAVAELQGGAARARIQLAAPLTLAEIEADFGSRIVERDELTFDTQAKSVRARHVRRYEGLVLSQSPRPASGDAATLALMGGIRQLGLEALGWSKAARQFVDRLRFLHKADPDTWPDAGDAALLARLEDWLAPYVPGATAIADIGPDRLFLGLESLLDPALRRRMDKEAPTHFTAPTGSELAVNYDDERGPAIAVRVQELFGLAHHPALAGGRVPLVLELLSPAHRPIQVTKDLPGFWAGSWGGVRVEMRGRYPRHVWPEDPAAAAPTTRAKPRGT